MHNLALTWQQAALLAVALFGAAMLASRCRLDRLRRNWVFAREAAVIAALYALWQLAGSLSLIGSRGAFARARWIERAERSWRLPTERSAQRLVLPHPLLAQLCNLYYATMHFAAMFALLGWLFVRHRDRYPQVRTTVVLLTATCLLIQFVPVAPPRLLPGYVDVAARYGQSVYGSFGGVGADQLSAMPSVHVGWAVLVGMTIAQVSRSRWRWLGLLHPVITIFVVAATGNHFWLDGIVAIALLALSLLAQRLAAAVRASAIRAGPEAAVTACSAA
jgi:PAP2 superfamily